MGFFNFFSSFSKSKIQQAGDAITQKIVAWDPETASDAEIEQMIAELDKITVQAGKAKAEYDREKAESDAAQKNYQRYLAAAELLNKQADGAKLAGDAAKEGEISVSLDKLLTDLETMRPEVEREATEAEEAKQYYEELKQLAEVTAGKLKTARSQLEAAKRGMRRAEIDKQRADLRAEKAEQLAGLKNQASSLGVALTAMNREAEEAKAKAAASDMKAKLLSPAEAPKDVHIEAAMRQIAGSSDLVPVSGNLSDRLAALRKK